MSILDDGKYDVTKVSKKDPDDLIVELKIGKNLLVNAPYFTDTDWKECIYVVIQNEKKQTPIVLYTAVSYKSACNYTVIYKGGNE